MSIDYKRKRALIIGINHYPKEPLRYCINDATDLEVVLRRIGFLTTCCIDCNQSEFYRTIDLFAKTIEPYDLVLFYFSGHGKQKKHENYMLPSDYNYDHRGHEHDYIVEHAISIKYLTGKIDARSCSVTIYLFDCCRNVIRTRATNAKQGLAPMNVPLQSLIVYACAPGKAVLDETKNNRNGSFMENLLNHIGTPDKDIQEIMELVAHYVSLQTDDFQKPVRETDLTGKVFLVTKKNPGFHVFFFKFH